MVSLAKIFALPREELKLVLATQGRSLSPDEKDPKLLNKDRALVAMIYYNARMITSSEEKDIIKHPNFFSTMSSVTSLGEGLRVLKGSKAPLPPVLESMFVEYLEPEEAFVYSLEYPDERLIKQRGATTYEKAILYAIKHGWVAGLEVLFKHFTPIKEQYSSFLSKAGESGHLNVVQLLTEKEVKTGKT